MTQQISAVGHIATAPKLFTPPGGTPYCTFRLACTDRRYDGERSEWVDGDTNWFTVNTFRTLANHAHLSFAKGDRVVVAGKLRVRAWESEERRGTSVEIDAEGLGHDVRWGVSTFVRQPVYVESAALQVGAGGNDSNGEDSSAEDSSRENLSAAAASYRQAASAANAARAELSA